MRNKIIAFLIVAGASAGLFVALHQDNRADAAAGNCYTESAGPSTPTICN